ncbi:MAG: response regulator, partial [Bacteroidota bacterium]
PEEGRVTFSVDLISRKEKNLSNVTQDLLITVADTGIGIPEKQIPYIFDRFTTGDQTQDGVASSGIGLALVRELVKLMDARIEVNSITDMGTKFSLWLPVFPASLAQQSWEKDAAYNSRSGDVKQANNLVTIYDQQPIAKANQPYLLITEDNPDLREYIADQFRADYNILLAEDGETGLSIAQEKVPVLIITDIMMPKVDGIALTSLLKSDVRTSHVPVIMLTAKAEQEDKLVGLTTGADDYLTKPFDAEELRVRVDNLIKLRHQLRERFSNEGTIKLKEIAVTSLDEQFLQSLVEIIERRIDDDELTIEELASEVGVSRVQLHRKLKSLTGKSPSVFLRTIRLHRSKELLEKGAGNVSEVCFDVGFSSLAYFSKCFKD